MRLTIKKLLQASTFLTMTTPLDEIQDPEVKDVLQDYYDSNSRTVQIFATIINACYTEKKKCFNASKRPLENLVEQDSNAPSPGMSDKEYTILLAQSLRSGSLQRILDVEKIPKRNASAFEIFCDDLPDKYFIDDTDKETLEGKRLSVIAVSEHKPKRKKRSKKSKGEDNE